MPTVCRAKYPFEYAKLTAIDTASTRSLQALEDGPPSPTESVNQKTSPALADTNLANLNNGMHNNSNSRQKNLHRLASGSTNISSFRGGQRRSSPTSRAVTPTNKAHKRNGNGEQTPATPGLVSSDVTGRAQPTIVQKRETSDLINSDSDKIQSGHTLHVDPRLNPALKTRDASLHDDMVISSDFVKEEDADNGNETNHLSNTSHSASAPEAETLKVSPACVLLQNQLDDLRTVTAATQSRLQSELEDLRSRNQDEEAVRAELKSRTKVFEETKRSAEQERLEAEKKLIVARANKKAVEDRVGKAKLELSKLDKKEKEAEEKHRKATKEREEKLLKLRDQVKNREELLQKEVEATDRLADRVEQLECEIEDRKNDLQALREDASQGVRLRMTGARPHDHVSLSAVNGSIARQHSASSLSPNLSTLYNNPSLSGVAATGSSPYNAFGQTSAASESEDLVRIPSPGRTPPGLAPTPSSDGVAVSTSSPSNFGLGLPVSSTYKLDPAPLTSSFLEHRLHRRRLPAISPTSTNSLTSSNSPSFVGNPASAASALYSQQVKNANVVITPSRDGPYGLVGALQDGNISQEEDDANRILGTFAPFGPSPDTPGPADTTDPIHAGLGVSPPLVHVPYFTSDSIRETGQSADLQGGTEPSSTEDFASAITRPLASTSDPASPASPSQGAVHDISPPESGIAVSNVDEPAWRTSGSGTNISAGSALRKPDMGKHPVQDPGGGPLSPMTPHQASLIPSQLFDLLDDVEMPNSPSIDVSQAHHAFSQGVESHSPFTHGSPTLRHPRQNVGLPAINTWEDGLTLQPSLSRKPSKNRGHLSPPGLFSSTFESSNDTSDLLVTSGGRLPGPVSPSLSSATIQSNSIGMVGFGNRTIPQDLLFDKARHVLSLNPDAKAFSFNRPLPSSGSLANLARSGASSDPRSAFESGGALNNGITSIKQGSIGNSSSGVDMATWISPIPGARGLPPSVSNATFGHAHSTSAGTVLSQTQQNQGHGQRSHSGPAAGSSFSPFDDDDLLKGW